MRVIFWGTYDTGKPRTRILREGLLKAGAMLQEIHAPIWEGIEDKSQVKGRLSRAWLSARWLLSYPRLAWRLARAPTADLILLGYPGILDAFVAAPIARLRGIPIAWDVFLSIYDTVCEDRRLIRPSGMAGRVLRRIERAALGCVDLPFMDTHAHARRIETLLGLEEGQCDAVWVGVESAHFTSTCRPPRARDAPMRVLFYGQFIPLHGLGTIIRAARLLRDAPVEWILIGRGQEAGHVRAMLAEDPLPRVQWIEWVDYRELGRWLSQADLCLGIFGTSGKAASVIPNKVFQIVAAGRPLLTRDSPAIRELLSPDAACTYLIPAGDPAALAEAVLAHSRLSPEDFSGSCHSHLSGSIDSAAIGRQFMDMARRRQVTGCNRD